MHRYKTVLSIAGSDPSGGAGIQADIKSISATGAYAMSVITALTAQNTQGVQGIYDIEPDFIEQQLNSIFLDIKVDATKIGMLHSKEIITIVNETLKKHHTKNIVLDPVMVAKGGCELLKSDVISCLKEKLFSLATLITPNIPEAEKLINKKLKTQEDIRDAAIFLGKHYQTSILIKGGHAHSSESIDILYNYESSEIKSYSNQRINTNNTHGTGCSLSSAIASFLAQDYELTEAIELSKKFISNAIGFGKDITLGSGHGPIHHFYNQQETLR